MDPNTLTLALTLMVSCFVCLTMLLVLGIVGFFLFRQGSSTAKTFTNQPEKQGEDFLDSASLRPWSPSAWADLSSRWEGWWFNRRVINRHEGYTQGIVRSLADSQGDGWIAFTVQRQQVRTGTVILKTSHKRIELKVSAKSVTDVNIQAVTLIDGLEDGAIVVNYPSCHYRSQDGAVEAGWTAELRWNNERHAFKRLTSRDVQYDQLMVNGRKIASLTDTWIRYPHPESVKPFHPALQQVDENLTAAEENVLLIALAVGLYYDSLRNRGYIYDW
jgi:hypothetical protein